MLHYSPTPIGIYGKFARSADGETVGDLTRTKNCFSNRIVSLGTDTEHQELFTNDDCTVAFDGFLFNREQLARELAVERTSSCAEIVAHGFTQYGNTFVTRLNGPFALLVYRFASNELWFARDSIGQRPLLYFQEANQLVVGQSLATIQTLLQKPLQLNLGYCAEYLLDALSSPLETIWLGAQRLEPGCLAHWRNATLRITRYWNPPQLARRSFEDTSEEFASKFSAAVSSVSACNGVALSLSGGIDSAAIAAFCPLENRVSALSITFPPGPADERHYQQLISTTTGMKTVEHAFQSPLANWFLEQLTASADLPIEPNGWLTHLIRGVARKNNCGLLLTGYGGDELSTGYIKSVSDSRSVLSRFCASTLVREISRPLKHIFPQLRWYPTWCTKKFFSDTEIESRISNSRTKDTLCHSADQDMFGR